MSNLEKAKRIHLKVAQLMRQHRELQENLNRLQNENDLLQQKLEEQTKTIEKLEEQNKLIKLADGIQLGKRDVTELKLEINRYIRDIDECLKLLNHVTDNP